MMDFFKDDSVFYNDKDFASIITIEKTGQVFNGLFDYATDDKDVSNAKFPIIITSASNVKGLLVGDILIVNEKAFKLRNEPEFTIDSEMVELKLSLSKATPDLKMPMDYPL